MTKLTFQTAFDKMLAHLRQQGRASVRTYPSGSTSCRYRASDGAMCAVGCLIPDNAYDGDLEGACAASRWVLGALEGELDLGAASLPEWGEFLRECQRGMHDQPHRNAERCQEDFLRWMEVGAAAVAVQFGLTYRRPGAQA